MFIPSDSPVTLGLFKQKHYLNRLSLSWEMPGRHAFNERLSHRLFYRCPINPFDFHTCIYISEQCRTARSKKGPIHNQTPHMIINHIFLILMGPCDESLHPSQANNATNSHPADSCFKARRPHLHPSLPASFGTVWHASQFVSRLITCKFQTDYPPTHTHPPPVSDTLVRSRFDLK